MADTDDQYSVTVDDDGEGEWQVVSHRRRDHETASAHGGSVVGSVSRKGVTPSVHATGSNAGGKSINNASGSVSGSNTGAAGGASKSNAGKNNTQTASTSQSAYKNFQSNAKSGKGQQQGRSSGTTTPKLTLSRAHTAESTTGSITVAAAAAAASSSNENTRPRFVVPTSLIQAVAEAASSAPGGAPVASSVIANMTSNAGTVQGGKPLVVYDANTPRDVVIAPELRQLLKSNNKQVKIKMKANSSANTAAGADFSDTASVKSDKSGHSVKSGRSSKASRSKYGYGKISKNSAAEPVIEGSWRRRAEEDVSADPSVGASDKSKQKKRKKKSRSKKAGQDDSATGIEISSTIATSVQIKSKPKVAPIAKTPLRASTASGIVRTASQNAIIHEEGDDADDDGIMLSGDEEEDDEVSIGSDEYSEEEEEDGDSNEFGADEDGDDASSLASEDMVGTGVLMIPPKVLYATAPKSDASSVLSYADHLKRTLSGQPQSGETTSPATGTARGTIQFVTDEQTARKIWISRSHTAPNDAVALSELVKSTDNAISAKVTSNGPLRANKVPGFSDDEDETESALPSTATVKKPPAKGHAPTRHNTLIDERVPVPNTHAAVAVAAAAAAAETVPSTTEKTSPSSRSKADQTSNQNSSKKTKTSKRPVDQKKPVPTSLSESIAKALSIDQKQLQAAVGVITILILLRLLGLL